MIELREDDPGAPHVAALIAFHVATAHADTPIENSHALGASGLCSPAITFWTAWRDDRLAGMGALKDLGGGHGEVKSMRTVPQHLRQGVGRAILTHLVETARTRGYHRISLETGTAPSYVAANALYETTGFVDGPVFGGYPDSPHNRFMTLAL